MSRRLGIPLAEYHELTPFELNQCAEINNEKNENDLFLQYINAYWHRVDPLKSFEEMMGREKKSQGMSEEEMLAKVADLNHMFGGATV